MRKETARIDVWAKSAGCPGIDAQGNTTGYTTALNGERVEIAGWMEIDAQEENGDLKMPVKESFPSRDGKVQAKKDIT